MAYTEEQLQSLFKVAERHEQKARRRAFLYSLIPIPLAALLLAASFWAVREARDRLAAAEVKIQRAEQTVSDLQKRIDELTRLLNEKAEGLARTTEFERRAYRGDIYMTYKRLAGNESYESQARMLDAILDMQRRRVPWRRGGVSPGEGFDSPGFAAYMLAEHRLISQRPSDVHYGLRQVLPDAPAPDVGDVVFYPGGYAMFYFKDERDRPFVVGMTPEGIFALEADFLPAVGYGKVRYRRF
ncbi:MAG TPA: hypothetical protein VN282_19560 [Pyrinomonadaceae bacterium]|nr:hypothetical protein [Pyrinomonadaceae bacterium]